MTDNATSQADQPKIGLDLDAHKEKFAAAFLRETGLDASQVVMNVQQCTNYSHGFYGTKIWFEKKEPD